jgi:hypothetical protein
VVQPDDLSTLRDGAGQTRQRAELAQPVLHGGRVCPLPHPCQACACRTRALPPHPHTFSYTVTV